MNSITFKYNKKKIVVFIVLSIIFLFFFYYILLNAYLLAQREPSKAIIRYRWVGELFYDNPNLIIITSIFFIVLFFSFLCYYLLKLFQKEMTLSLQKNKLYINGSYLVAIKNIEFTHLVLLKHSTSIYFYLNNAEIINVGNNNLLERYKRKIDVLFNKKRVHMNISLLEMKPNEVYTIIKEFITIKKRT